MENFQQLMYLSSIAFCGGWFLFAPGLALFSPAAPKLRSFGIMFGSLALGAASLAHMIMALFRNGIGVAKSQCGVFVMPGLSFGDLARGRKNIACAGRS